MGAVERSWAGIPESVSWTRALLPFSALYGSIAARARAGASRKRRPLAGTYVIAVGGLTVGGSGKSSLARWIALEASALGAHPAVLLRGHGARRRGRTTDVVPDFSGYPLSAAVDRVGDEALAHRAALPRGTTVAVDRDRYRSGGVARDAYGATVLVLDDGWEQDRLRWDELWIALDPASPFGNGALLPAGPLRRSPGSLREATVVALVHEDEREAPPEALLGRLRSLAPSARLLRFRRRLDGARAVGAPSSEPWNGLARKAGLISGVGSPERLTRFARASGIPVVSHVAFPDHAQWSDHAIQRAAREAAGAGAEVLLITEKDEPRWPPGLVSGLPVLVLRTSLEPLDPRPDALESLRGALAALPGIG